MTMLHPILCLDGKRKEIFDLIFSDTHPFDDDKTSVANILLKYEDVKLTQLFEEVKNSNNKLETVLGKEKDVNFKKIEIPKGISF